MDSQFCQTMPKFLCPQHKLPLLYLNLDQTAPQKTMCQHCPHIGRVIHVENFQNILNESEQVINNTVNQLFTMFNHYQTQISQYLKNLEIEFQNLLLKMNIIKNLENESQEINNIDSLNTIVLLISTQIGQNNLINHDPNQYAQCLQMIGKLELMLKQINQNNNDPNIIMQQVPFNTQQEYQYQSQGNASLLSINQQGSIVVWISKNSIKHPTINILTKISDNKQYEYDNQPFSQEHANFIEFHPKKKMFLLNNQIYEYFGKWELKRKPISKEIAILGAFNCYGSIIALVNCYNQITLYSYLELEQEEILIQHWNINRQILDIRFDSSQNLLVLLQGLLWIYRGKNQFTFISQLKLNENTNNIYSHVLNVKQFYIQISKQNLSICDSKLTAMDNISLSDSKIGNVCYNEKKNRLFVCDNYGRVRIYEIKQNLLVNPIVEDLKLQNIKDIQQMRFCLDSNKFVIVDKKMTIHILNFLD